MSREKVVEYRTIWKGWFDAKPFVLGALLVVLLFVGCLGGRGEDADQFPLTVVVVGEGSVYPADGPRQHEKGAVVILKAAPDDGWKFVEWKREVAEADKRVASVNMDRDKTVTAVSVEIAGPSDLGEQNTYTANGVEFPMRLAPAATFPTGVDDDGEATVAEPFWIAETQTTYELWYTVLQWAEDNSYTFRHKGQEGSHGEPGECPSAAGQEPVTRMFWRDCVVWCNALSEMLGYEAVYRYQGEVVRDATNAQALNEVVQEDRIGFRLPTTEEWELAARYRGTDDSPWGSFTVDCTGHRDSTYESGATYDHNNAVATQKAAWYEDSSERNTHDVGQKQVNGLGLYDMSGNVWEFTFTRSGPDAVGRGGSHLSSSEDLRVGAEGRDRAVYVAGSDFGFRFVKNSSDE